MKKLLAVLIALLLFCSCGAETVVEYEYTDGYSVITEPFGKGFLFPMGTKNVLVGENTYIFHPDIAVEARNEFIAAQEKLLENATKLLGTQAAGYSFYVLPEYISRSDFENKSAYFGINELRSQNQVTATVLALLGDFTNYGYAYAAGSEICKSLKWETEESAEIDVSVLKAEPELLNLVYPCFTEKYSDAKEVSASKAIALKIYSKLSDKSEAAFTAALDDFAAENGIDFTQTELKFAYASESCPLKIRGKYLDISVDGTYVADVMIIQKFDTEPDFLSDLPITLEKIEALDEKLGYLRGLFKFEGEEPIPVHFTDKINFTDDGNELWGYYNGDKGLITTRGTSIIVHEYVHYLMHMCADNGGTPTMLEDWYLESIAYYFGIDETYKIIKLGWDENFEDIFKRNHGFEIEDPRQVVFILDADMYFSMRLDPKLSPKDLINVGSINYSASFGAYVAREYGEQTLVDILCHPSRCAEFTGKTFEEIEDAWEYYLMNEVPLSNERRSEIEEKVEAQNKG